MKLEDVFAFASDVHAFSVKVRHHFYENQSQMLDEDKRKYHELLERLYSLEDALDPFVKEYPNTGR